MWNDVCEYTPYVQGFNPANGHFSRTSYTFVIHKPNKHSIKQGDANFFDANTVSGRVRATSSLLVILCFFFRIIIVCFSPTVLNVDTTTLLIQSLLFRFGVERKEHALV